MISASLWRRAPLWRFSALSCAFSTLLFLLYAPHTRTVQTMTAPLDSASYTPPPAAAPPAAAAPVTAATTEPKARPAELARAAPKQAPSVVGLSLATPANHTTAADKSGIDPGLMGRTYHDYLLVNGFKVPLPRGEWAMLANTSVKALKDPNNTGTNYFLAQIENKRLVGAVQILTLRSPASPGTGFVAFNCDNPDYIYEFKEDVEAFGHQSCWVMHNFFTPPWQEWADQSKKQQPLMRAAAGDMAAKGITYPQDLVDVQFYRSEAWGLLEANYLFSPEKAHIVSNVAPTFRDADWWGPNLHRFPDNLSYIEDLKIWGNANWPRFKQAFDAGRGP